MLKNKIVETIRSGGPMPIDQFMARALFDAEEGYYTTKNVFGRKGDFITAPEICQIFGEMIAVFLAGSMAMWREQQAGKKIQLVELGPGRGTLMHDMLRTMQFMPEHARPNSVKMIEASGNLRDQQQHILAPFMSAHTSDFIEWYDTLEQLPNAPSIIIANEFFDALPIRQFVRRNSRWFERMVGENEAQLTWVETACETLPSSDTYDASHAEDGDIFEISPHAVEAMSALCTRVSQHGGMAIIIDYGYTEHAFGDTLQAVKKHAYANVLEDIGAVDITAHVNFAMLKDIAVAKGLQAHTLTTQGSFLRQLGAELRLSKLCQNAEPGQIIDLIKGLERLMSPAQMGELFKVLIVASQDVPVIQNWE